MLTSTPANSVLEDRINLAWYPEQDDVLVHAVAAIDSTEDVLRCSYSPKIRKLFVPR
jgi:hypothetical protein